VSINLTVHAPMPGVLIAKFCAGAYGDWRIESIATVVGEGLPAARRLQMVEGATTGPDHVWQLCGVVSNSRYSTAAELVKLTAVSPALGRPEATAAALIPIRKTDAWWKMAQDDRRAIFEERSKHIARSMKHVPAVARRLHHARDLGEPFDFLTWFEFAPQHGHLFQELVEELRTTEEWQYVDREVDIRLVRETPR
jgi:chlorite dismutase